MQLVAHNLHKTYAGTEVVRGVDLTVTPGQVLGLLGPNGAGKSTTVGMLYGAVIPSQGSVRLGEWDLQAQGRQARSHMGVVPQDDNLDPDFDVWNNLACFARHYGMTGKAARDRINTLLEQVGLSNRKDSHVEALSGGLKRRLVLARALCNHPKIVFLDEPTTGLDPDARQDFWKLVTQLKQSGCGIVLTTHYMDEAERLCDRLLLMQAGCIVDRGRPSELIERTIGKDVVEVEGLEEFTVRDLAQRAGVWWRGFGTGFVVVVPDREGEEFCQAIEKLHPTRFAHRKANLEDVFLRLTGTML
ncbi:MAG: ATP-binding cassette domain-containing protein [Cyanobacteria bacterium P01_D01_bin.123]